MSRPKNRRPIPMSTKVAVARSLGNEGRGIHYVYCWYCLDESRMFWRRYKGNDSIRLEKDFHWDHRVPRAAGGGNEPENIRIACARCNLTKGARVNWIGPVARWKIDNYPGEYDHLLKGGAW